MYEVKKENGRIVEVICRTPDGSGMADYEKYEFEYTEDEIDAPRFSQMINYFVAGSSTNYYINNWY